MLAYFAHLGEYQNSKIISIGILALICLYVITEFAYLKFISVELLQKLP